MSGNLKVRFKGEVQLVFIGIQEETGRKWRNIKGKEIMFLFLNCHILFLQFHIKKVISLFYGNVDFSLYLYRKKTFVGMYVVIYWFTSYS